MPIVPKRAAATVLVEPCLLRGFRVSVSVCAFPVASVSHRFILGDLHTRDTAGIGGPACGASSSPNSSGTGQFPFGKGLGDAAPGGVPLVKSRSSTAHNNYSFSTN